MFLHGKRLKKEYHAVSPQVKVNPVGLDMVQQRKLKEVRRMPRTKLDKIGHKYDPLVKLINGEIYTKRITRADAAVMCGFKCPATLRDRMKHPENFTLGEIASLARGLDIPIDDIRERIPK